MKILHLEDISSVTFFLEEKYSNLNHTYQEAVSLFEMNDFLTNDRYDCLIIDINLSPRGLPKDMIHNTLDGKITGWIWIKHVAIPKYKIDPKDIIIYSDYIHLLDDIKDSDLSLIKKIPKRKAGKKESSLAELDKAINAINIRKK